MGLRDYLATLGGISEASNQFSQTAEGLRKAAAQRQFEQEAPELFRQGKLEEVAAKAAAAGNNTPTNELLSSMMKAQLEASKAGKKTDIFTPELLTPYATSFGVPTSDLAGLVGQPVADVQKLGKAAQDKQQFASTSGRLKDQFGVKVEQFSETKLQDVAKSVAKKDSLIADSISKLNSATMAFKEKATPAAANIMIRSIVSATGDTRMSDQDIAGLKISALPNKSEELYNFLQGAQGETLTSAQKQELLRIGEFQAKNAADRRKTLISMDIKNYLSLKLVGQYGLEVSGNRRDGYEIILDKKTAPQSLTSSEGIINFNSALAQSELINDPQQKEFVKSKLQEFIKKAKTKPMPREVFQDFADNEIKPYLPQK
jgi:hypothetical protein